MELEVKKSFVLITIGLLLWTIPALLIAVSDKYQNEISVSKIPYMPFFMEIFGMTLVLTGLICIINHFIKSKIAYGIQIVLLLIACIMIIPVYHGASGLEMEDNLYYKNIREDFVAAINGGILDEVADGDKIILDDRWAEPVSCNIFTAYSDRNITTSYWVYQKDSWQEQYEKGNVITDNGICYYDATDDNIWISKAITADGCGEILLGHVKTVYFNETTGELQDVFLDKVSLYVNVKDKDRQNFSNYIEIYADGALLGKNYSIWDLYDSKNTDKISDIEWICRFEDTIIKSSNVSVFENAAE
jgi:hypothetical protein